MLPLILYEDIMIQFLGFGGTSHNSPAVTLPISLNPLGNFFPPLSGCFGEDEQEEKNEVESEEIIKEHNIFPLENFTFENQYNNNEIIFENAILNDNYSGLRQRFRINIIPSNATEYEVRVPAIIYNNSQIAKVLHSLEITEGEGEFDFILINGAPFIRIIANGTIELYVYRSNSNRSNNFKSTNIDTFAYGLSIIGNLTEKKSSFENFIYTKFFVAIENEYVRLNITYRYSSDDGWLWTYWNEFNVVVTENGWHAAQVTRGAWGE